ncbi:YopX family protein [Paenibacillus jamilae]|uniref:YopX family protein n=1 Tax=Paenibacillus jamilae TaxID=114136 RepID=UPI003D27471C
MRDSKFRGKKINYGEWIYGVPVFDGDKAWIVKRIGDNFSADEVHPESVGQYTGLKDKNGEEIYGGHLVARVRSVRTGTTRRRVGRTYNEYAVTSEILVVGEVRFGTPEKYPMDGAVSWYVYTDQSTSYPSYFWGDGKASDKPYHATNNLSEFLDPKCSYEIVGSIHDNPELLQPQGGSQE